MLGPKWKLWRRSDAWRPASQPGGTSAPPEGDAVAQHRQRERAVLLDPLAADGLALVDRAAEARIGRAALQPSEAEVAHGELRQVGVERHAGDEAAGVAVAARLGVVVDLVLG